MSGRTFAALVAIPLFAAAISPAGAPQGTKQTAPPTPKKSVEEPVFQLPELVIIGENQARIMAQKERLVDSPMRGLGEAPLLEKEEETIAGVRRRVPVAITERPRMGPSALARIEGGSPGFAGGAIWIGRSQESSLQSFEAYGSQLTGDGRAGEPAGEREFGLAVGTGYLSRDGAAESGEGPAWARALAPVGLPDSGSASLGWRRVSRELPYSTGSGDWRHVDRLFLTGESGRSRNGFSGVGQVSLTRVRWPGSDITGGWFTGTSLLPLMRSDVVALSFRPRGEAEAAEVTGNRVLLGGDIEAAVIKSEKIRFLAGISVDWAGGEGFSAGQAGVSGGLSWISPWGPSLAVSFDPGLNQPWMSGEAARVPYSSFSSLPVPERVDADLGLRVWQEHWDGSELSAEYRYRQVRDALSWEAAPAGLWEPAALDRLKVSELTLSARVFQLKPVELAATGTWRSISASGGKAANLPCAEGTLEARYPWKSFAFSAGLDVVQERPGSFSNAGGDLEPFRNLRVRAAWRASRKLEVYSRADNLLGRRIERWQGYPEPERLISVGALASF